MKTIYSIIYTSILSVFIVGLFFSNAMLSISTVMLFVFAIIAQLTSTNKNKFTLLQFAFLLLFIIYVCWSFYLCSNVEYFIASIVSKLSLLGMALFLPQININKKQKFCLLALMLLIIIGISFYTIIIYFNAISFWKNAYSTGLVLPTFMHHSKYSFLIAISILVLLYSIHHSKKYRNIKIVLATDHGSTRVKTPYKVIGDKQTTTNLRYKHGRNLQYEAKEVLAFRDPRVAGLPVPTVNSSFIFRNKRFI